MESNDKNSQIIVGLRQSLKALKNDNVVRAYVAEDVQPRVLDEFVRLCSEKDVEIIRFSSMKELGKHCNIEVGAAVACHVEK